MQERKGILHEKNILSSLDSTFKECINLFVVDVTSFKVPEFPRYTDLSSRARFSGLL
jgi:hypothetical protein